jgi:hypothetical protein
MKNDIRMTNVISSESVTPAATTNFKEDLAASIDRSVKLCRNERKKRRSQATPLDISDAALQQLVRFTDGLSLSSYRNILHLVPRLVNVRAAQQQQHNSTTTQQHNNTTFGVL